MGLIHQLDPQLTNMIAAGEVVERPMGIVKELLENAIDAKSTRIEVSTKEGGISLIKVIDNGMGMDSQDATVCFERHATSKIKTTNDLWQIHTMGFRGEALPSIASVSKVNLLTCDGKDATQVIVQYGKLISAKPLACNQGTTIEVEGLFYKTPARLKHLKSPAYENSLIQDVIQKYALAYPSIAFVYNGDGKESFRTSGNGDLKEVIFTIYGKDVAKNAIAIEGSDFDYQLSGYMMHPSITRASRNGVTIFMNNRLVRPYKIQKAIVDSYYDYIPHDRYPLVILNIKMDSKLIDVNVHPSKWEVRLSKEQQLEYLVKNTLIDTLRKQMSAPELKIEKAEKSYVAQNQFDFSEKVEISVNETPIVDYKKTNDVNTEQHEEYVPVKKEFPTLNIIGQMHGKFILCENEKGLYVIDQHAAQERVHFEQINKMLDNTNSNVIGCLVPYMFKVGNDIVNRVDEINAITKKMNIIFEPFSNDELIVRKVPIWMQDVDAQQFIQDLLDYFIEEKDIKKIDLNRHKIATMACHRSIRFNRHLSLTEMKEVVQQLSECEQPFACPHGRPTFVLVSDSELEKEFLR